MNNKIKVFLVSPIFGDLEITSKILSYPNKDEIIIYQHQRFIVESVCYDFDDDEIRISVKKV